MDRVWPAKFGHLFDPSNQMFVSGGRSLNGGGLVVENGLLHISIVLLRCLSLTGYRNCPSSESGRNLHRTQQSIAVRGWRFVMLELMMRLDDFGDGIRLGVCGFGLVAHSCDGEPIVFVRLFGDPGRKWHTQMLAERGSIALIQRAKITKSLVGVVVATYAYTALAEQLIKLLVAFPRQSVRDVLLRSDGEDLCEIDHGVTSHGKGQLRLASFVPANAGDEQSRSVEHRGERADPALIGVLRAKIAKQGVGDVALKQFSRPAFPLRKQGGKDIFRSLKGVSAHEFSSCRWRACARVEERDTDLTARKCCVQHREVAHDDGEKAEAGAGFTSGKHSRYLV